MSQNTLPISATIITFNEEDNIKRCIQSLSFCEEVIVIDSFSTDKTREIAESLGAKVFSNTFDGYGQQKNFAVSKANHEWILNLDGDEEITPSLVEEISALFPYLDKRTLYQIPRLTQFCGKWIRHGGWYPNYVSRIYNKSTVIWSEPEVHESLISVDQEELNTIRIKHHMLHFSFPTFKSQLNINIKYAALGAQDLINRKKRKPYLIEIATRPIGKFIECYFVKLGLLDGKEGLFIALNASYSMYMKYSIAYFDLT